MRRDQGQRWHAVSSINRLRTPPEDGFDGLARLGQRLFPAPVAAVTVVDADRFSTSAFAAMGRGDSPRTGILCPRLVDSDDQHHAQPGDTLVGRSDGLLDRDSDVRTAGEALSRASRLARRAHDLAERTVDVADSKAATDDVIAVACRTAA